jgi:F420-non-reducing hydrogenase small subunit
VRVKRWVRPHEATPDGASCLLDQGIVCAGPATRSGCGAACLSANMPCRGCYGPVGKTIDPGAAMIGMLGSLADTDDEREIRAIVDGLVDPVGTFYRFGLGGSLLGRAS